MLTVDANVWVAAFDPTDALHAPSVSFLRYLATRRDSDCAPSFLALEVGCALTRRLARPEAGAAAAAKSSYVNIPNQISSRRTMRCSRMRCGPAPRAGCTRRMRSIRRPWQRGLPECEQARRHVGRRRAPQGDVGGVERGIPQNAGPGRAQPPLRTVRLAQPLSASAAVFQRRRVPRPGLRRAAARRSIDALGRGSQPHEDGARKCG